MSSSKLWRHHRTEVRLKVVYKLSCDISNQLGTHGLSAVCLFHLSNISVFHRRGNIPDVVPWQIVGQGIMCWQTHTCEFSKLCKASRKLGLWQHLAALELSAAVPCKQSRLLSRANVSKPPASRGKSGGGAYDELGCMGNCRSIAFAFDLGDENCGEGWASCMEECWSWSQGQDGMMVIREKKSEERMHQTKSKDMKQYVVPELNKTSN